MSGFPTGVRDGDFVKFEGWDISGNDVGLYFLDLSGQDKIDALKAATLQYGACFFTFNSNGWCKTWSSLSASNFVKADATLYIRVQYPGWVFYPFKDSPGNDFGGLGINSTPAIIAQINQRSNPFEVVAFNTNGWIKSKFVIPLLYPANSSLIEGTYVRANLVA